MERECFIEVAAMEDKHWWYVSRRHILRKVLDFINLDIGCDILEAGCGSGGNLKLFSFYGNLFAMELDDDARTVANNRRIIKVEKGSLPYNIPFDNKRFDIIAILDVLEHIDDDLATLRALRNRLKDDGKLLVTVPAYQFLWSTLDVVGCHKRRYLQSTLKKLICKAGFSIFYSTYFNTILFPLILAIRFVDRIFRKKNTSYPNPPKIINSLLTKIFSCERFFIPRISLPFGVSILIIAQAD